MDQIEKGVEGQMGQDAIKDMSGGGGGGNKQSGGGGGGGMDNAINQGTSSLIYQPILCYGRGVIARQ